ncbi:MAG: hypothetical protein IK115_04390 [Lachnospiraceae bacterium]|nr:hypothetical protein [Lachnospiraceae bacterium]
MASIGILILIPGIFGAVLILVGLIIGGVTLIQKKRERDKFLKEVEAENEMLAQNAYPGIPYQEQNNNVK